MNIYKLSVAISAVLIVASCTKEININEPGTGNDITVRSKVATKAGYTSRSLPEEFVMDIIQGETGYNYSNVRMYADPNTGTYRARSSQGNNIALKWANSNHSGTQIKAMTIPSDVATTLEDYQVFIEIEKDQTTETNFNKNDILGAGIGAEQRGVTIDEDDILLDFTHLMSKLHVVYELIDKNQTVEYIKLKNVCTEGYYSYNDMTGGQPTNTRGEINMFLNPNVKYGTKAAEAIFYPYTVGNTNKPQLVVKLSGSDERVYNIPVSNGFSFAEGKRYLINIEISTNGTISAKDDVSSKYNWVQNVPGGKILWVGTSIPAGSGINNYPQMVANATGLEVINNAVGGSVVLKAEPAWINAFDASTWNYLYAGGLSQTIDEARSNYAGKLNSIFGETDGSAWLSIIESLSYESLIIPYIDGTKDNCQTIIIDHGFNDIPRILYEAGAFNGMFTEPDGGYAHAYFEKLINGTDPEITYDHYKLHLQLNCWDKGVKPYKEDSYLLAMEHIINECRKVNPNINIIIGNYFAKNTTWIHHAHYGGGLLNFKLTSAFCNYNRAVAALFDCQAIVNVYEDLDVTDEQLWSGNGYYDPVYGYTAYRDESKFCPDGIHPSSDGTGNSNRRIADVYLNELGRIFGGTNTKTTSNTVIPNWEDVEIL